MTCALEGVQSIPGLQAPGAPLPTQLGWSELALDVAKSPGSTTALVEPGTACACAQGGLIMDGPGQRGRAGGRPGAQSRLGTEGGRAPVTWGPRHCQGPGSTLGWDPDPEGRRRSECPASEMWHRGAQKPGWRASWKVHSGRRALGGQALGPSASMSLHLSLGGTVRVRVHPPTEEGTGPPELLPSRHPAAQGPSLWDSPQCKGPLSRPTSACRGLEAHLQKAGPPSVLPGISGSLPKLHAVSAQCMQE